MNKQNDVSTRSIAEITSVRTSEVQSKVSRRD